MSDKRQQALDSLYAIDNVLTIAITMPDADWNAVRTEQPAGGVCNFEWTGGSRFTWRTATSVEISGTQFPARTVFTDVGVKKKSFCGSLNSDKPCLHIDFGKFDDANVPVIQDLIGTRYLTLNNSIQDRSYIRQTLGYRLLGTAGLPHSRCHYARVLVNGVPIGQGRSGVNSPGVYVSAEPIMKPYVERNFGGNTKGNLYELEHHDDLVEARLKFIEAESLSAFDDKADLKLADDLIAADGLAGAERVLDLDQFVRVYAMDFLFKHWDGYSRNTNNTYLYNDLDAVARPGAGDVRFKMVHWGIDQILQPARHFSLGTEGLVAKLVRDDPARRAQVIDQIRTYRDTVFGRTVQRETVDPLIDRMQALLVGFGVPGVESEIATVRHQLRLAASAGSLCAGLDATRTVVVLDDNGECLHASGTEPIPAGAPDPLRWEVYHRPLPDADDDTDLWRVADLGSGKSITSQAYGRVLHASDTVLTDQGHKALYTCAPDNGAHAEEFSVVPVDSPDPFTFSGQFQLTSVRTGLSATYGTDPTPAGRPRVYQDTAGSTLHFW